MDDTSSEIPDFSGDDFANDKDIRAHRLQAETYQKMIEESVQIIKTKLGIKESAHRNLKTFSMFRNLQPVIVESFGSCNNSGDITASLAQYKSSFPTARNSNSSTDLYLFGRLQLIKRYPKTYICRETIREKINDLFLRHETDFPEHRKFSRKFYVLTQNSDALKDLVRIKNLDELTAFPEMVVESHENICLFRNSRKPLSPKEATEFSELAISLIRILN